jgi:hypothetical protein
VVFGDQHYSGLDEAQGAAPFAEQLYAELVRAGDRAAIGMECVVTMECLREIDTQAVDVELLDESGGTTDE